MDLTWQVSVQYLFTRECLLLDFWIGVLAIAEPISQRHHQHLLQNMVVHPHPQKTVAISRAGGATSSSTTKTMRKPLGRFNLLFLLCTLSPANAFLVSSSSSFVSRHPTISTVHQEASTTMASSDDTVGDNSPKPFIKCCIVEVHPDRAEEFSKLCEFAQAKSLADEPGCLRLDILHVTDEGGKAIPNKFIVYEIFTDKAAYKYHGEQPYSKKIGAFVQSGGVAHEDAYVAQKLYMTEK